MKKEVVTSILKSTSPGITLKGALFLVLGSTVIPEMEMTFSDSAIYFRGEKQCLTTDFIEDAFALDKKTRLAFENDLNLKGDKKDLLKIAHSGIYKVVAGLSELENGPVVLVNKNTPDYIAKNLAGSWFKNKKFESFIKAQNALYQPTIINASKPCIYLKKLSHESIQEAAPNFDLAQECLWQMGEDIAKELKGKLLLIENNYSSSNGREKQHSHLITVCLEKSWKATLPAFLTTTSEFYGVLDFSIKTKQIATDIDDWEVYLMPWYKNKLVGKHKATGLTAYLEKIS